MKNNYMPFGGGEKYTTKLIKAFLSRGSAGMAYSVGGSIGGQEVCLR